MNQNLQGQFDHTYIVDQAMGVIEQGSVTYDDAELARLVKLELLAMGFEPETRLEPDYSTTVMVEISK